MNKHRRHSPSALFQALGIGGCICVALFSGGVNGASAQETKTLTRFHDPVVMNTSMLMGLPTRNTVGYRLYSAHHDILSPIPFQFDERDERGEMVFSETAAQSEFQFDENDELVFMAKDTGDRIATELLPAMSDAAVEIEVTDPVTRARGWAYLLYFPGSMPPPRRSRTRGSMPKPTKPGHCSIQWTIIQGAISLPVCASRRLEAERMRIFLNV